MSSSSEKWTRIRIRLLAGFFMLLFAATAARAVFLQIIDNDRLVKLAERQHQKAVPLTPARGSIFDRNRAELAVSIEMDSCYAEPRSMKDMAAAAAKLAPLLGTDRETLLRRLGTSRHFVWLHRRITPEQVQRIKALRLEGIGFVKESKRFYPNSEIAAHVVGFTGLDPEGLEGIELRYDSTILGNSGYMITERDALGRDIGLKSVVVKSSSKGNNVTLTLDKNIQYLAEKELAKAVIDSRARAGMALVMEARTGKILAMANYPTFNPNAVSRAPAAVLRNRTIVDSFEPGSTFKVFLIAAALEEGVVRPGDFFNCENGSYQIGGRTIHDTHKYGSLSVGDILKYSSNIGAAKIGSRLGQERLSRYLRDFGFGERSGIDLPGEVPGTIRGGSQWYGVDLATISFGQGVTATALQLASALSAVANGGVLMKPYLVEQISDEQGNVLQQFEPQPVHRVISAETAQKLAKMMEGVTAEGGTGTNAAVEGYRVAGKTGTAQKVDPVTRGYSVDKRTASFFGFVPVSDPALTILVVIDEPKTNQYGGVVAAPVFKGIAQQSLCYLQVPPDAPAKPRPPVQVQNKTVVAEQSPVAAEGTIVEGGDGMVMPDFRRMSMRQVLQVMEKNGLNILLQGSGRAVEQRPQPGQRIGPTDRVWVRFTPSA